MGAKPLFCWSCHNDIQAPYKRTHSSLEIDNGYGDWSVECRTCHNPHSQKQIKKHKSESHLFSGVSTTILTDQPTAGKSQLTIDGTPWTVDEYAQLVGEDIYYVLIPNVSNAKYGYKILSNTANTLTVEGQVNLSKVNPGSDTFAIIYGKLIKSSIGLDEIIGLSKTGDKTVKFFNTTLSNSFADGDSTYDGICEVCHTQTFYNRNDPTGDHFHGVGENCTKCHAHTQGFKGTGCNVCHGYPPVDGTPTGGPDALANNPGTTGSTTAGAHDKHVNTKGIDCAVCHYNSAGFGLSHNNGPPRDITIGFSLFDGEYLGGIYDGQTTAGYDSSEANTTVINTGSMSCDNIYCHGRLPNSTVWGGGKNTVPTWDGSVTCTSCFDRDEKPVKDAIVFAHISPLISGMPLFVSDRTGDDGKYMLRVDKGGEYYLRVRDVFGGGPPHGGPLISGYSATAVKLNSDEVKKGINISVKLRADRELEELSTDIFLYFLSIELYSVTKVLPFCCS